MRGILSLAIIALVPFLSGCGGDPERVYEFKGRVVSIDGGGTTATIDHEDIPGLMRAMKRPFTAEDPRFLEGLVPGMPVEGKIKIVSGRYVLTELKRKGGPIGAERAIQEALSKLAPEDRKLAEQQYLCPISNEVLGSRDAPVKLIINGEPVFICCESCRKKAGGDPEATLKKAADLKIR
jgi:Cu/Ag efflux protein CusF